MISVCVSRLLTCYFTITNTSYQLSLGSLDHNELLISLVLELQMKCFTKSSSKQVPTDRWLNGHKYDRWPVDQPVDRHQIFLLSWLQRLYFFGLYMGAVLDKIFGEFQSQFFPSLLEVFSTCFRVNTSISKGEFSRVISKVISWVFTSKSILVFLTQSAISIL